nr:unnamed protein product [Callosobruchus analis]
MTVKIFCALAFISLSSAQWAPKIKLPYIPSGGQCQTHHTIFLDSERHISSQIRLPWDGSSFIAARLKLVFGRLMPDEETNVKIKMVTPHDLIPSEGLRYVLHYPNQKIIPQLTEIKLNGRVICSGEPEQRKYK